jgi:small-conductance mechanosensitive channel
LTNRHAEISPRQAARIAGYGYLAIFVLAIFANFFVRERLIEPGDAAATASNIMGSEALFRLGLVSFLAVFVLDLVIAWALYVLFRHVSRDVSLLTAWFRLVYTTLLGVALIFLFLVLQLVSGAGYLTAFEAASSTRT